MIKDPSNSKENDNPIYRTKFDLEIRKSLPENNEGKALELIINKLGLIENVISPLKEDFLTIENDSYYIIVENCLDKNNKRCEIEIHSNDTVQDVLDKIYFKITSFVKPYEYMQTWVLRESSSSLYMIMYEVTTLVPAKYIFKKNQPWQIVEWNKYNITQSKYEGGI